MKTILTLFLFCCLALVHKAAAQSTATDSVQHTPPAQPASRFDQMRSRPFGPGAIRPPFAGEPAWDARHDARKFQLPKALIPKVRDGEISANSDYFKPTPASTPVPEMLADSAYVKDYRFYAYTYGRRQLIHPTGTGLLIAGGVVVVVTAVTFLVITLANHIQINTHMTY